MQLLAEWDGHGMAATQSHAFAFEDYPARRVGWPTSSRKAFQADGWVACIWSAITLGIVETALETARVKIRGRRTPLRAYEQVELARAELECWLLQQAYEGMLRSVERGTSQESGRSGAMGKLAIAALAETVTGRICRVVGGSSYSMTSPFGHWFEDVRALGFLRPPWALAYDQLINLGEAR